MSTIQTYLLYYFIIIFTSIAVSFSENMRDTKFKLFSNLFFWLAITIPILISGFRYGIGADYFNYERIYYHLTNHYSFLSGLFESRYEPSWVFLNNFVKLLFDDVKFIFIISSIIILVLHFKAIRGFRGKVNIGIATIILLCTLYNPSFNIIRLAIAASIIMIAVKPMLERKVWKFLFLILFSASFHYTSLAFLPAYWIINSNKNSSSFFKGVFSVLGAVLLLLFAKPIMSFITSFDLFSSYSHYSIDHNNIRFGAFMLKLPIIAIILLNINKLKIASKSIYKLIIIYFIGIILSFFEYLTEYGGRIAIYFEMMQIFILSAIVKVQGSKYEKVIYSIIIIMYFLGWYTFEIIINNGHRTVPYMWVW